MLMSLQRSTRMLHSVRIRCSVNMITETKNGHVNILQEIAFWRYFECCDIFPSGSSQTQIE